LCGGGSITHAPRALTSERSEISFSSSAKGISSPRGQTIKNFIAKPSLFYFIFVLTFLLLLFLI
jgi:hypothetical protein